MYTRALMKSLILPSISVGVVRAEGKDDECDNTKKLIRPRDLALYVDPPKCVTCSNTVETEDGFLLTTIRCARQEVQAILEQAKYIQAEAATLVDNVKKETSDAVSYLQQEENLLPRLGAIGFGALAGYILAVRKGIIKKVLYSAAGAGVIASVAYPNEAREYSEEVLCELKKYAVIGYHLVNGADVDWKKLKSATRPPCLGTGKSGGTGHSGDSMASKAPSSTETNTKATVTGATKLGVDGGENAAGKPVEETKKKKSYREACRVKGCIPKRVSSPNHEDCLPKTVVLRSKLNALSHSPEMTVGKGAVQRLDEPDKRQCIRRPTCPSADVDWKKVNEKIRCLEKRGIARGRSAQGGLLTGKGAQQPQDLSQESSSTGGEVREKTEKRQSQITSQRLTGERQSQITPQSPTGERQSQITPQSPTDERQSQSTPRSPTDLDDMPLPQERPKNRPPSRQFCTYYDECRRETGAAEFRRRCPASKASPGAKVKDSVVASSPNTQKMEDKTAPPSGTSSGPRELTMGGNGGSRTANGMPASGQSLQSACMTKQSGGQTQPASQPFPKQAIHNQATQQSIPSSPLACPVVPYAGTDPKTTHPRHIRSIDAQIETTNLGSAADGMQGQSNHRSQSSPPAMRSPASYSPQEIQSAQSPRSSPSTGMHESQAQNEEIRRHIEPHNMQSRVNSAEARLLNGRDCPPRQSQSSRLAMQSPSNYNPQEMQSPRYNSPICQQQARYQDTGRQAEPQNMGSMAGSAQARQFNGRVCPPRQSQLSPLAMQSASNYNPQEMHNLPCSLRQQQAQFQDTRRQAEPHNVGSGGGGAQARQFNGGACPPNQSHFPAAQSPSNYNPREMQSPQYTSSMRQRPAQRQDSNRQAHTNNNNSGKDCPPSQLQSSPIAAQFPANAPQDLQAAKAPPSASPSSTPSSPLACQVQPHANTNSTAPNPQQNPPSEMPKPLTPGSNNAISFPGPPGDVSSQPAGGCSANCMKRAKSKSPS